MDTNKNQPDIDTRINNWKRSLGNTALTVADIEELSQHLRDAFYEVTALGLSENEAWLLATHRIGKPEVLNTEFKKVNTAVTTNTNWMMMLWGAVGLLILQGLFIALPMLFSNSIIDYFKPSNSDIFLRNQYYSISVIVLCVFIFIIIKGGSIIRRFTNSLTQHASLYAIIAIVAGLWSAFLSYIILMRNQTETTGYGDDANAAFSFLIFGFYFSLITLTAFSTIRYYSHEVASFKMFNKNINWKHALILGILAQTPVQFSYGFPGNEMTRAAITITISVLIFLFLGWMISHSGKGWVNIASAQAAPMVIWIYGTIVNEHARTLFLFFYLSIVVSLLMGYYFGRLRHAEKVISTL